MNEIIERFVEKRKKEIQKEKLEKRKNHLLELGIIDTDTVKRTYLNCYQDGSKYDNKKHQSYIETYDALDVTDEEYAMICKLNPENQEKKTINKHQEDTLRTVANFILIASIIAFIILFIAGVNIAKGAYMGMYLIYGFFVLFASIIFWSALPVIANISSSLKDINTKIK